MKVMVTGGAGFIGSNFIHYLQQQYPSYEILNFDKLTYAGNLENVADFAATENYTFVKGDIADKEQVEHVVQNYGVECIINYAAETHVDRSIERPEAFLTTDVFGVYNLLEAVKKYKLKRLVQISTDEVFGTIDKGRFSEQSAFLPNSPYAAAKAGGDLLCRAYFETYDTPVIVTHSCNIYGPYQYPEKLLPLFITNILEGKKLPLYGDGKNVREWLFVEDHCRAIDLVLHRGVAGAVYNIGSGEEKNNLELTDLLLSIMGRDKSIIEYVSDRPGHDRRYAIDWQKIERELGWRPTETLAGGLARTVDWYSQNESWWKKIKSGEFKEYYQRRYGGL